jgi:hypothetical protein
MKRVFSLVAVVVIAIAAQLLAVLPANASTQVVGFRAASWRCPKYGVYDVTRVDVSGTDARTLSMRGEWQGSASTARVTITGVPAGGAQANVTVTYRCKVTWLGLPGYGEPASGIRWIYGSGTQPTYTL